MGEVFLLTVQYSQNHLFLKLIHGKFAYSQIFWLDKLLAGVCKAAIPGKNLVH